MATGVSAAGPSPPPPPHHTTHKSCSSHPSHCLEGSGRVTPNGTREPCLLGTLPHCQGSPPLEGSSTEAGQGAGMDGLYIMLCKQQRFDPSCLCFPSKQGRMPAGQTPVPGASIQTPGLAYFFARFKL